MPETRRLTGHRCIFIRPKLVDSAGREYQEYDGEAFYVPKGKKTISMEQLTPSVQKQLWAVYEVAADATGLMFRARSLASADANALVALDICPDCGGSAGLSGGHCAKCKGTGVFGPKGVPESLAKLYEDDKPAATGGDDAKHDPPAPAPSTPDPAAAAAAAAEEKARALLNVAEQFAKNKMPDKAIEKLGDLIKKYPDTQAAKEAQKRLEELQAGGSDK